MKVVAFPENVIYYLDGKKYSKEVIKNSNPDKTGDI
jgi:hypothetical protein